MPFNVEDGRGAHALDYNTLLNQLRGEGVVTGGEVAPSDAGAHVVTVEETLAWIGDTLHDVNEQDVDLEPYIDDRNPRKAVVYITDGGVLDVAAGAPARPLPSTEYRFDTYRPAPPDFADIDGVPLAEVWLSPDDVQTTAADLMPRSVSANINAYSITAETGDFSEIIDGAGVSHTGELADMDVLRDEQDIRNVINWDAAHGADAPHNYFSGSHTDLTGILPGQHHPRYTDPEAREAVRGVVDAADLTAVSGTVGQHLEYQTAGLEWADPPLQQATVLRTGTVTHTGGGQTTVTIAGVTADETAQFSLSIGVESDPEWEGAYAYSHDYSRVWNPTTGEIDIELTLDWATDPGAGNDLTVSWTAWDTAPAVVDGRWSDADTIQAMAGATIAPAGVNIDSRLKGPVVDNLTEVSNPRLGYLAIASGDGGDPFGQFIHNGEEWVGPLGTSVSALSDINVDVAKSWAGNPILDLGAPQDLDDAARVQEINDHSSDAAAHHAKTTSADIDHAEVSNVQPDQHHSRPDEDEMVAAVSGRVHSIPLTASTIPSGEYLRSYVSVDAGETLTLVRGSYCDQNGNTPSGLSLQLYNRDTDTVEYEQTAELQTGSPLATISGSAFVEVRISNTTGSSVSAGGSVNYHF